MDIASSAITFVTTANTLYNTIKSFQGLPKEFDETERRLPLALATLEEFRKHISDGIEPDKRIALEEALKPCIQSAQKLEAIFEGIKKHEGRDGLSRYRIVVIKMGKASRVEVLLQEIMKCLQALAINYVSRMANSIPQLTDAIEVLSKVESSIPDKDFNEDHTTNLTQSIATGATGHQTSNRDIGHQNNNYGGTNYLSNGGTIQVGTQPKSE